MHGLSIAAAKGRPPEAGVAASERRGRALPFGSHVPGAIVGPPPAAARGPGGLRPVDCGDGWAPVERTTEERQPAPGGLDHGVPLPRVARIGGGAGAGPAPASSWRRGTTKLPGTADSAGCSVVVRSPDQPPNRRHLNAPHAALPVRPQNASHHHCLALPLLNRSCPRHGLRGLPGSGRGQGFSHRDGPMDTEAAERLRLCCCKH